MRRIGIIGGSFNPITNSHIEVANHVLNQKYCDQVYLMPANMHPFKILPNFFMRCEMIEKAIKPFPNIILSQMELQNIHGTTYNLMKILKKYESMFDVEYRFIIGSDIVNEIDTWYKYEDLVNSMNFIIISRAGHPIIKNQKLFNNIDNIYDTCEIENNSSSEVRHKIANNESIDELVPTSVNEYIKIYNLYVN